MRKLEDFEKLKKIDTYSLILFALYKLKDIPEYRPLSELCYLLSKNDFLKLCQFYGGTTLKIPTVNELKLIVVVPLYIHYLCNPDYL